MFSQRPVIVTQPPFDPAFHRLTDGSSVIEGLRERRAVPAQSRCRFADPKGLGGQAVVA